eukprot:scaffold130939_cov14-Tisochrysis_lutea.AAC.2
MMSRLSRRVLGGVRGFRAKLPKELYSSTLQGHQGKHGQPDTRAAAGSRGAALHYSLSSEGSKGGLQQQGQGCKQECEHKQACMHKQGRAHKQ